MYIELSNTLFSPIKSRNPEAVLLWCRFFQVKYLNELCLPCIYSVILFFNVLLNNEVFLHDSWENAYPFFKRDTIEG